MALVGWCGLPEYLRSSRDLATSRLCAIRDSAPACMGVITTPPVATPLAYRSSVSLAERMSFSDRFVLGACAPDPVDPSINSLLSSGGSRRHRLPLPL